MADDFPELCVQTFTGPWWEESTNLNLRKGRLVYAFVPHVDSNPRTLEIQGRPEDQHDHSRATFKLKALRAQDARQQSKLPVALLPEYEGEVYGIYRTKRRPVVVLHDPREEPPKAVRQGGANWQGIQNALVVPAYGVEKTDKRVGWPKPFVDRIQRAEYPGYMWDRFPDGLPGGSILRLDQIVPMGTGSAAFKPTKWCLTDIAHRLMLDWLEWYLSGEPTPASVELAAIRGLLLQDEGSI